MNKTILVVDQSVEWIFRSEVRKLINIDTLKKL